MLGFVVRTRNEEQYIGFALQSIFDRFGADTPVVVIDNASSDNTLRIVQDFPKKFHDINVLFIPSHEYTPGKALNTGIEFLNNKKCTIAGILSAHCEITQANSDMIEGHLKDDQCVAVMGKQVPIFQGKRITPRYIWANFSHLTVSKNIREATLTGENRYFFHNAFSFVKISAWKEIGFDEKLSGKEDRYWAKDHIEVGRYFLFDPNLTCRHFWTENGATWRGLG